LPGVKVGGPESVGVRDGVGVWLGTRVMDGVREGWFVLVG
jgi:hypothetical protein